MEIRELREADVAIVCRHREEMFREAGSSADVLEPMTNHFREWIRPRIRDGSFRIPCLRWGCSRRRDWANIDRLAAPSVPSNRRQTRIRPQRLRRTNASAARLSAEANGPRRIRVLEARNSVRDSSRHGAGASGLFRAGMERNGRDGKAHRTVSASRWSLAFLRSSAWSENSAGGTRKKTIRRSVWPPQSSWHGGGALSEQVVAALNRLIG